MADCFARIKAIAEGNYTDDEINQILRDTERELGEREGIAENSALAMQDSIDATTKRLTQSAEQEQFLLDQEELQVARSANLFTPFEKLKIVSKQLKRFGESLTLQTKLGVKGAKARSLILHLTGTRMEHRVLLSNAIESIKDGLAFLKSGEYDVPILKAINGKETNNPIANELGKAIRDFRESVIKRLEKKGIVTKRLRDRGVYQFHDAQQLLKTADTLAERTKIRFSNIQEADRAKLFKKVALNRWVLDQERLLDLDKTFGDIPFSKRMEIYKESFDNITSDATSLGSKSVQSQVDTSRFFHYKDEVAQLEYNKKYGRGDLFTSLMQEADSNGAKIATLDLAGNRPLSYIEKTIRLAAKQSSESFTKDEVNRAVEQAKYNMQLTLGHATTTQGLVGKLVKAVQLATFAKIIPGLPALVLVADVSPAINTMADLGGKGIVGSTVKLFGVAKDILKNKEEIKNYAEAMGFKRDIILGSTEKWSGLQNRDLGGKLMTFMMKISPHEFMNYVEGLSTAHELTLMLGQHSGMAAKDLPAGLKKALDIYGIEADRWDLLRKGKTEVGGYTHLTSDAMRNIGKEDVKAFITKKFGLKKVSDTRVETEREQTQQLFTQMVTDKMSIASNVVDARQTKFWTLPFNQTTDLGRKAANLFQLFGSLRYYETAIVHRTLAPLIYGDSGETAFRQIISGKFDKIGLARWAAISFTFSTMGFTMQSMLKGQIPDPEEILTRSLLAIPGAIGQGLEVGKGFGHGALQSAVGPAPMMLFNAIDDLAKVMRADHPGKNAANFVTTAVPGFNSTLGRNAFRHLLQYQFGNMWGK